MNLLIRLMRIVIHAFFRPKLSLRERSITTFRVRIFDLDINRHMTNSRYLSMMDLGRTDLLIRTGLAKIVWKNKWSPVLGSTNIRWRKSLLLFQKYEIHTEIAGWDDKWFYLEQKAIYKGRIVAHALQKAIFVGKRGAIPALEIVALFQDKYGPMKGGQVSQAIITWQKSEEFMRQDIQNEEKNI